MRIVATPAAKMSPKDGVPRGLSRAKAAGRRPSCAAARGSWPESRIQPLSAPKQAIVAPAPITRRPAFPQIDPAASAKGAVETARSAGAMIPITAEVLMMKISAATAVPRIVARGIVRAGSRTSAAGTVAASSPMKAHSVSVTVAVTAATGLPPPGLNGRKCSG